MKSNVKNTRNTTQLALLTAGLLILSSPLLLNLNVFAEMHQDVSEKHTGHDHEKEDKHDQKAVDMHEEGHDEKTHDDPETGHKEGEDEGDGHGAIRYTALDTVKYDKQIRFLVLM